MSDDRDYLALDWVKEEIRETLTQAQHALEAYVENPADSTRIQFCLTYLHQVYGTLQMVEFPGAALLAEEMEKLARAIESTEVPDDLTAKEVLMAGILHLPRYLDRVKAGRRDSPILVLPQLNDLRAARGDSLLSETALFKPDIESGRAVCITGKVQDIPDLQILLRKIRQLYQFALVGIVRNKDVSTNVAYLSKALARLERLAVGTPLQQLWRVSSAVVEGVAESSIGLTVSIKMLLSLVDQQIKEIAEGSGSPVSHEPPEALLKNLLYYVAKSGGASAKILAIVQAYRLDASLPGDFDASTEALLGPDQDAMFSVVGAIQEELSNCKETLDLYVRSNPKIPEGLHSLIPSLKQIADTLAVLGIATPRHIIHENIETISKIVNGADSNQDAELLDVAGALLYVEATLNAIVSDRSDFLPLERVEDAASDQQVAHEQVVSAHHAVVRECLTDLEYAKEGIVEFIASQWDKSYLRKTPKLLGSVRGGLVMASLDRPAIIIQQCRTFIVDKLIGNNENPDWKQLDTLADAITSVEYFLECMCDGDDENLGILEIAEEAISALGYPLHNVDQANGGVAVLEAHIPLLETPNDEANPSLADDPDLDSMSFDSELIDRVNPRPESVSSTNELLNDDEFETDFETDAEQIGDDLSSQSSDEGKGSIVETSSETTGQALSMPAFDVEDDLIDDEVIEIFIEEAEEVLETLNEYFPIWRDSPNQSEPLAEIRRAFHTLKGSGRMVGALEVAELAWSVENLLNRIIESTIKATSGVFALVEHTLPAIPVLVKSFQDKVPAPIDISGLQAIAEHLARGEAVNNVEERLANTEEASIEKSTVAEDDIDGSSIDPVLIDIFRKETFSHLAVVGEFLGRRADHSGEFTPELLRALHTLKGSAHTAGIQPIVDVVKPLENFIKTLASEGIPLDTNTYELLDSSTELVQGGIAQLELSPLVPLPSVDEFCARIDALQEQYADEIARGSAEESDTGAPLDPQLIAMFLAEAMDLVLNTADTFAQWKESPVHGKQLDSLNNDLDNLSQHAQLAQLIDVESLCIALNDCYSAVKAGKLETDESFFEIMDEGHESLIDMTDRLAAGQAADSAMDVVLALRGCLDASLEQVSFQTASGDGADNAASGQAVTVSDDVTDASFETEDETEFDISDETLEDADFAIEDQMPTTELNLEKNAEAESSPEPELEFEADPELVEIFLEEAMDIVESTSTSLQNWIENPSSTSDVEELQRDLHTLKGGARLAGIMAIGDLAHEIESAYEGICDRTLFFSNDLVTILHKCHDRLAHMVESIQNGTSCLPAGNLQHELQEFMSQPQTPPMRGATSVVEDEEKDEEDSEVEETEALSKVDPVLKLDHPEIVLEPLDDLDSDIFDIFLEEADELVAGLDQTIHRWSQSPNSKQHIDELQRLLHTLKGSARLAGLKQLGDLSHDFEGFLETNAGTTADKMLIEEANLRHDGIIQLLEAVKKTFNTVPSAVDIESPKISIRKDSPEKDRSALVAPETEVIQKLKAIADATENVSKPAKAGEAVGRRAVQQEMVRVSANLLEELVNLAGETSISRGRVEQEVTDFSLIIDEMATTISRVREQLRRLDLETEAMILFGHEQTGAISSLDEEFDPLEMDRYSTLNQLSRSLVESVSDLQDIKDTLIDRTRDTETLLVQQGRINTELQEGLMRTRMEPFSRLTPRLRRLTRQVASQLGKEVEFEVINAEGELDKSVLDRMVAPLEHMLRNAVDHGIEMPDERKKKGKNAEGRITLHLVREGSEVVLRMSDDGAGIDVETIRARALKKGLMADDAHLTDNEVMQFILSSGFSTAKAVTQISGRGVGLDVVHREIKQLGGSLKIHSAHEAGSQFTIRLPFTVAVNRALMVRVAGEACAIPLNNIEGIVRVNPMELDTYYQDNAPAFNYAGQSYILRYLGSYVHGTQKPNLQNVSRPLPVLLVRGGEQAIALQVDSIIGAREVVVKAIGPQLSSVAGISGATILGDGSVVVILDLLALIRAEQASQSERNALQIERESKQRIELAPVNKAITVMVVDDSVTVRKVTSRLLERHGMNVVVAKDGVHAVSQLRDTIPDVMLLDIEMPRMDGFEVATLVRHDERLKHIPIIMITSRTGDKHRERAYSIGVNQYMGKPFQEAELMESIEQLIGQQDKA